MDQKLIACANVLEKSTSVYKWKEQIEIEEEWPVLLKSKKTDFQAIEACFNEHHPYELPCLIELNIDKGSQVFLNWIKEETQK